MLLATGEISHLAAERNRQSAQRHNREPDIILNVAAEIRPALIDFIKRTFGDDCVFRAGVCVKLESGRIRRGVHPGGIFIVPPLTDINEFTAVRECDLEDEFQMKITEWDYHEIDGILAKYYLLTIPELSMIHELENATGIKADTIRTNDPEVTGVFLVQGLSFLSIAG